MPSPFPGMNPYFERSTISLDFHTEFLTSLRRLLVPQVTPKYFVQLDEHVYIHDAPTEERRWVGRSDLSVAQGDASSVAEHRGVGLLEPPAEVFLPEQDLEGIPFLEIRDRENRELITVIELLSPSNKKPGPDREQYIAKRREYLRSAAHLVEIDLLRGWKPMPALGRPECDYSIMVSRGGKAPCCRFLAGEIARDNYRSSRSRYGKGMARRMSIFRRCSTAHMTARDTSTSSIAGTPEPPLSAEDDAWAQELIAAQRQA